MSVSAAPIDVESLRDRFRRAAEAAAAAGVDALLVSPGSDLRYLLGAGGSSFERLTCLVLPAAGSAAEPALVVPKLEHPGYAVCRPTSSAYTWRRGLTARIRID
ncbi:hypothetical protein GCM10018954_085000 [Kutzneria kofuensis]